ncbi:MAG: M13 family metallopeptidase [Clostridia bacterium]
MKKGFSLLLIVLLVLQATFAFAACDAPQWINSGVIGNVTNETEVSLKDDFHLAVNKDWLVAAKIAPGQSRTTTFNTRNDEVRNQILSLIKGEEQASYEGKLVQQFYRDYTNMDARNERGMAPVMPFIEEIQKIETLDQLTAYALRQDQLSNALITNMVIVDFMDSTQNAVYIAGTEFMLDDADEYKHMTSVGKRRKEAVTVLLQKLFERIGYAPADATATIEQMFSLETAIASASSGSSDAKQPDYFAKVYNPVTAEELAALSPTFPILTLLKGYTDVGVERFILMDGNWLAKMNELYTPENLEAFKAMLLCNTLRASVAYLDQPCIDLLDEVESTVSGMKITSVLEDEAYTACSNVLGMAIGKMFAENYLSPETKENVENLIGEVVAIYKNRLAKSEWLGKETREKAIEKLDNLRVRVAYPDDWSKYDVSDIVFPEDGNLLDDMLAISLHTYHDQLKSLQEPIDPEKWPSLTPQTVNAFYSLFDNSINILGGILGGAFYDPNGSIEQTAGGIGIVIGHEITHGFDTKGSQCDKDGNMNNWWTDADRAAFVALTDKVDAYFSAIEVLPGQFVDGQLTISETVADLGGFSAMLELAKDYENFDYDLFFKTYARVWPQQATMEVQESQLLDVHAPGHLRTNVTVQQFQEFYDTYGVTEGDGMYLAPECRLSVW